MTTDLSDASLLHLLLLAHAHGGIDTLFSIENGAQENLVSGGGGEVARRIADQLGDSVRLRTPVLALEIAFDPPLPEDRKEFYRNAVGGCATKTLVVYEEPFWRSDGLSGQTAEPGSAVEVTIDAGRPCGPGILAAFAFGPIAERLDALADGERRKAVLDALVARLLDGALHARHAHAAWPFVAGTLRKRALGGHRDGDDFARRDRRRRSLR